jgi:hypothetical protein
VTTVHCSRCEAEATVSAPPTDGPIVHVPVPAGWVPDLASEPDLVCPDCASAGERLHWLHGREQADSIMKTGRRPAPSNGDAARAEYDE